MTVATAARPAQFDRSTQHRRGMLAKIHIARQQLGLVEDDYRQALFDLTGRTSAAECSDAQLERMIGWLKSKGFKPIPTKATGSAGSERAGKTPAMHPMARKARALWISLYHLNVVRNPAEEALEAFAARQLGCERLVWARQSDAFKLVEALKSMAERNGWRQTDGTEPGKGRPLSPLQLQIGLCHAILARLKIEGVCPAGWSMEQAMESLCGEAPTRDEGIFAIELFTRIAATLGTALRKARSGAPLDFGDNQ